MAKKLMLITGSSGRIGKVLVHRFADDYQVVGFDRKQVEHVKSMDHMTMDLSSDESVKEALELVRSKYGQNIDTVIHLAAYYSFENKHLELYDKITVQGTRRLLEGLQSFNVGQFFFSSTLLVYAPCKLGEKINENSPLGPEWEYPKSKVKTELMIHQKRGKIPAVIMQIAGCYDDECHSIPIAHNIQRIYEHELEGHLYPGDIRKGNPFLHLDDLVDAFALAIQKRDQLPDSLTLIISEDKTASYQELQNKISECLDCKDYDVFRVPKWVAKEGAKIQSHLPFITDNFIQPWMIDVADDHYAVDISLAKKMIGWQPKHYVLDEIPVMTDLLKTDPLYWYQTNDLIPPSWLVKKVEESKMASKK